MKVGTDEAPATTVPAWRRHIVLVIKLSFMAAALWLVAHHLDLPALAHTLQQAQPGWLLLATGLFTLSKLISSVRLNTFFRVVAIQLTERYNLRLYWLGMFYNLFLPGGIGGDGYKVYLLGREFPGRRVVIFRALLLDRLSGMVALLVLLLSLFAVTDYPGWWRAGALALVPLGLGLSYGLGRWLFGEFRQAFGRTSWQVGRCCLTCWCFWRRALRRCCRSQWVG
jgi:uncharacterized protein (TIRG00374 family)